MNEDFNAGRRLEQLASQIGTTISSVNSSTDSWAEDLNRPTVRACFEEYLTLAKRYEVPQKEVDRITSIVTNIYPQTSTTT